MDINDVLLENRIIYINGEINGNLASYVIQRLLYLDSISHEDISLYINSAGGGVIDGLAIIDCMNILKSSVATICVGCAYSMAAIILASGTIGKRYSLLHSEIMLHEPFSNGVLGKESDIKISLNRVNKYKESLIEILISKTKKNRKEIERQLNFDNFLNPMEARKIGIIDKVIKGGDEDEN